MLWIQVLTPGTEPAAAPDPSRLLISLYSGTETGKPFGENDTENLF